MADIQSPKPDGQEFAPASSTIASNHYNCSAKRTGFGDYVACLETPPHHCGYAMHMGDEYLCLHPQHLEFAAHTEAQKRARLNSAEERGRTEPVTLVANGGRSDRLASSAV